MERWGAADLARVDGCFEWTLTAAQAGTPWALEHFWRRLAPVVAGYMRTQGAADPDDLTSDVFMKVFTSLSAFEGGEVQFRSWVFAIAHHRLVDERRRVARRPLLTETGWDAVAEVSGGDVEVDALAELSIERVRRVCADLVPDQRDVLLLRMVGGMTTEETADALGKSSGAVKALQHRAVRALQRLVGGQAVSR